MTIVATAVTDRGVVRADNEDAVIVGPWVAQAAQMPPQRFALDGDAPLVVAVADGAGGMPFGAEASLLGVLELARRGEALSAALGVEAVIEHVHEALVARAAREGIQSGLAATLAGIAITPTCVTWFNVGDARVHVLAEGYLAQLSVDDRVVGGDGPVVTQLLGGGAVAGRIDPHVGRMARAQDRRFLISCDGLVDMLSVGTIETLLGGGDDAEIAAELVRLAREAGGRDNVTLVIVNVPRAREVSVGE